MFCEQDDVEARLRRELTDAEAEYLPGMIEEAQDLVLSFLGCPPEKYADEVPAAITRVTSRMVARVIQEGDIQPEEFGSTQVGVTAGPFSVQRTFGSGARTGAPWLTKVDRDVLAPYACGGKAFSVDTLPRRSVVHAETCSAINYSVGYWYAYCTCGADIAGRPIFGVA